MKKQRRGISQAQAPEQNADTSTSTSTATGGGGPVMGPSPEAGAPEEDITETAPRQHGGAGRRDGR